MKGILPKNKTKGTDICAEGKYYYIVRSELGYYMQIIDLKEGSDISIFRLHPSCKDGDHYLGSDDGYFFIIKGNSFRRVTNLTTDSGAEVHSLHPNCQGGDHYFSMSGKYYIIFQEKGVYRVTKDLCHYTKGSEETELHDDCRNGLYYWGMPNHGYFLKPASEWGVEFCGIKSFNKDERSGVYSVHPDVLNFLPGGLSVTKGPSFGTWENVKNITNDSNTPVKWQKKINKKVGYNKEISSQIARNWKITPSASIESGALAKLIAKGQFSFPAEYGGSRVRTEKESWNEITEEEEQLSFELKAKERLYLWQYKLGLGEESVLFCRDLMITDGPNPPTEIPLPDAES